MSIQQVEQAIAEITREIMRSHGISESMINEGYYGHLTTEEIGLIGSEIKQVIKRIYYEFGYEVDGYCGDEMLCDADSIRLYWENWEKYS